MTPDAPPVSSALPDLRAVRLDEMPALTQAGLDKVLARVLPATAATETVTLGTAFGSSI